MSKELVKQICERVASEKEKLEEVKVAFSNYVDGLLVRSGDLIKSIEYDKLDDIIAQIIEENTKTGIFEPIDGPIIKFAVKIILKKFITEDKFNEVKSKATETIDNLS